MEYAAVIDTNDWRIFMSQRCPPETIRRRENSVRWAGAKIDEVFIGSCMTNIGHFRAASEIVEGKRDIL